jgi:vanillate O-demethylase monooxygenase subunit
MRTDSERAWLRDCWYVIAWDHEIPAADAGPDVALFRRVVLDEPILVYRLHDGGFAAIEDRCCHRHAPLSQGRREGDCVRCGYHGLMFDARGACVDAPGLPAIPPKACVRAYPLAVRNRWIFVWMGDPARADAALLPDNFSCDHPGWRNRPGYLHYDTPYLLICDNLLDFSHLSYVHETSLGGSTKIARSRPEIDPRRWQSWRHSASSWRVVSRSSKVGSMARAPRRQAPTERCRRRTYPVPVRQRASPARWTGIRRS